MYSMGCKDDHMSCRYCLKKLLVQAQTDNNLWPLTCCGSEIDLSCAKKVLSKKALKAFNRIRLQKECKNYMWCQEKTCSEFINLDNVKEQYHRCYKCSTLNCTKCK